MKNFKQFIKEENSLEELCYLISLEDEILTEAIDMKPLLKKMGLKAHKEKGLIDVLISSGKIMSRFFVALLKAATGNEEAKKTVKELSRKEISRSDIMNVLIKVDLITLHAITLPLHVLDAITGWEVVPDLLHSSSESISDNKNKVISALNSLLDVAKTTPKKITKKVNSFVNKLKTVFKPVIA